MLIVTYSSTLISTVVDDTDGSRRCELDEYGDACGGIVSLADVKLYAFEKMVRDSE